MVWRRVSLFFADGMSEQYLALVPGLMQRVLAAGKSSLLEMWVLQDIPKGSPRPLPHLWSSVPFSIFKSASVQVNSKHRSGELKKI